LAAVDTAHAYVLDRTAQAIRAHFPAVERLGSGDLTISRRKFSGSAQRRLRNHLLIHATILYEFPLELIDPYTPLPTPHPPARPAARPGRAPRPSGPASPPADCSPPRPGGPAPPPPPRPGPFPPLSNWSTSSSKTGSGGPNGSSAFEPSDGLRRFFRIIRKP